MNKYEIKYATQLGFKYKKLKMIRTSGFLYFNKKNLYGLDNMLQADTTTAPFTEPRIDFKRGKKLRAERQSRKFFNLENLARVTVHNFDRLDKKTKGMALESAKDLKENFDNFVESYKGDIFEAYSKGFDKIVVPEMTVQVGKAYEEHMGKSPVSMITEDIKRETAKLAQKEDKKDLPKYLYVDGKVFDMNKNDMKKFNYTKELVK